MIKPTMTAAEKRIYLNAFAHACVLRAISPAYIAWGAVLSFRDAANAMRLAGIQTPEPFDMWEEISTIPLGL